MRSFKPKIDLIHKLAKPPRITFFEDVLAFLDGKMKCPDLYGWFHLLCLAIIFTLCVVIFFKAKNMKNKTFNLIVGITSGVLICLEIYKQLNYSYEPSNDSWGYQWYAFPFQFCSTPMYVMFIAAFLKEGKVKTSICSFLATYGLFAGAAVMFYPGDVFVKTIGINIQTMVHHGMMVVIGVLMYVSGRAKISHKTILSALPVFGALIAIALGANVLYHYFGDAEQTFNMFYISPYYPCTLPILSIIYPLVPYPVFLLLYLFGFTAAGYIMSLFAMGVHAISQKIAIKQPQRNKQHEN